MSAAVTLTISDGFIVGVDSAVTVSFGRGKTNIYEDTEKIFQLGEKRIGIATFGLAGIGDRSIGSFVREFESVNFEGAMDDGTQVAQISEALRAFFYQEYERVIIPAVEAYRSMPFQQIPINDRPYLGLLVGGYSDESKTREQIFVDSDRPSHGRVRSAAPKSGAPLTAAGRSRTNPEMREKPAGGIREPACGSLVSAHRADIGSVSTRH